MSLFVNYETLHIEVSFEIARKKSEFELRVLTPVKHICNKTFSTLSEVAAHIKLTKEEETKVFAAFAQLIPESEPLQFLCTTKIVECRKCSECKYYQ